MCGGNGYWLHCTQARVPGLFYTSFAGKTAVVWRQLCVMRLILCNPRQSAMAAVCCVSMHVQTALYSAPRFAGGYIFALSLIVVWYFAAPVILPTILFYLWRIFVQQQRTALWCYVHLLSSRVVQLNILNIEFIGDRYLLCCCWLRYVSCVTHCLFTLAFCVGYLHSPRIFATLNLLRIARWCAHRVALPGAIVIFYCTVRYFCHCIFCQPYLLR